MKYRKGEKMSVEKQNGQNEMALSASGENEKFEPSRVKTLVVLAADCVGRGNDELGRGIVTNFVKTMKEMGDDLWRLVLLNGGVKLAVDDSAVLGDLQELAGKGLGILVCGKCLETFGLAEKRQVGEKANMLDIVTSMQVADKVISLA
jgi:selenium metabolism protein YedF